NNLPKKADGSASMWGYWNNKGPTCQVTPISGTFKAGETVRSNTSATLVFQKYWTIGGQTYMQFATSPASGKFAPGDTLTGMTSSACAKMVAWPKIIGDHGTAYNWAGHTKSLMMNMGDNDNDANAMKGVGAQRLGLFFGDGVTGKSGLKKAYLFMMMKFPPNFFSMATSTTYNYVGFLKMWDMCPGFTAINYFGTPSEHAVTYPNPDNQTEYGATGGSLVQLQGGGLSNASSLFFNNLASNSVYSGGYWQYQNGAVTKMSVNGASDLQSYAQSGDWFGVEYAFDVGTLGNSNGTSELWIYDKNGVQKGYVAVTGQLNLNHFDHYVNKIVLGGNRRSGGTTTSTLDGRYFIDDVIIDGNRIGPKYFQLLSAYNTSATSTTTSGSTTGTTSGSTTGTTTAGLVAAYSFNEGTGTTVADKSGNGNSGTLTNTTWTTGKYGNALSFNGTSSMVTVKDSTSLHLSTGMTLEAWVMPTKISSVWQDVIYKGNDAFYLEATSPTYSEPVGSANSSTSYRVYGTSALTANTWAHLAATFDGTTSRLYVNGALVASKSQSVPIPSSTSPLQIGGDSLYGEWFSGKIDEVRVYNKALTQTQIQTDMQTAL
ncbi:LamG domain-containing protein, partial [Geomonas sp.]|uniref:LamG domain-containing protein n=1 Tax=Geomonas sp. TaxID=2651584 RepID=UPI002B4A998B